MSPETPSLDEARSWRARMEKGLAGLLVALGDDAGHSMRGADTWEIVGVGDAPLAVTLRFGVAQVQLEIGPWSQVWGHPAQGNGGSDEGGVAEDDRKLVLDLVAAVLFGQVELTSERAGEKAGAWTLRFWRGGRGHVLGSGGRRPWFPFAKQRMVRRNPTVDPPPPYASQVVVAPPWSPWAGAGGFTRVADEAREVEIAIDGELDLHNFAPKEIKPLLLAYIQECKKREITGLRIVHGKGRGVLRRTVHATLRAHPDVESFHLGTAHGEGSWGATLVTLRG